MLLRNDSVYHMTYISYHTLDNYFLYDFLYNTCIVCYHFVAFLASSANFGFSVESPGATESPGFNSGYICIKRNSESVFKALENNTLRRSAQPFVNK